MYKTYIANGRFLMWLYLPKINYAPFHTNSYACHDILYRSTKINMNKYKMNFNKFIFNLVESILSIDMIENMAKTTSCTECMYIGTLEQKYSFTFKLKYVYPLKQKVQIHF